MRATWNLSDHCPACGAVPDSTGKHHSAGCPNVVVDYRNYEQVSPGDYQRVNDDYYDFDEWVDIEPLILLELQKIRMVLNHLVPSEKWKGLIQAQINSEATWEDQMKALGRWDGRYEP